VLLIGQDIDLSFWERSLKRPFDPWCERIPQGGSLVLALRSRSFDQAQSADEVRGHAILLIERLNGALGVEVGAEPLNYQSIGRINDKGKTDIWVFPGTGHIRIRAAAPIVTVEKRDAKGNLIPPQGCSTLLGRLYWVRPATHSRRSEMANPRGISEPENI